MSRILVLGAGGPAGVNWLHALSLAGHDLIAVDSNESHLIWCEMFADTCWHWPEVTVERVNESGADVVVAVPDALVGWLSDHRMDVEPTTFLPQKAAVDRCQDKIQALDAWEHANLRSGAMLLGSELPDWLHLAADRFGLPFWLRATRGAGARGAALVENLGNGYHWLRYWQTRGENWQWMAEEYLPGRDYAWTGFYMHGQLVTSFARERLEYIYPALSPSGLTGTPTIARVVHDDRVNEVAEWAVSAVTAAPHGIFAVDLREDRYGMPRPTEINPGRPGTTTGIWATFGGANFAHLAVRLALGHWNEVGRWTQRNALPDGLELRRHIDCEGVFVNQMVAA